MHQVSFEKESDVIEKVFEQMILVTWEAKPQNSLLNNFHCNSILIDERFGWKMADIDSITYLYEVWQILLHLYLYSFFEENWVHSDGVLFSELVLML
jgi:hypothetical protein